MNQIVYPLEPLTYLKTALPSKKMGQHVDYYFEIFVSEPHQEFIGHSTLPTLNTFLCFDLEGKRWGYLQDNTEQVVHNSAFIGHTLKTRQNKLSDGMHVFFVALKPGVASKLFRHSNAELENTVVDLGLLVDKPHIEEKLKEQHSFKARMALFEELFLPEFDSLAVDHRYRIVQEGLTLFQNNTENNKDMKTICGELAVSYPTLYRYFKDVIEYAPHFCKKLIKFKEGLKAYKTEGYNFEHWRYGFTDFSHFVKTTNQLTGLKPSEL